jgi:GrpB-like predicted nucleotidyltransferase (UPF0157 family)
MTADDRIRAAMVGGVEPSSGPIVLGDYDPAWPVLFEREAERIREALGDRALAVEHTGSTSVPGLAAKPIVDVMVGVEGLEQSVPARPVAESVGYCWAPYRPEVFHWFCKPSPARRTHHLILVPVDHPTFAARLAFRDALREDASLAAEYEALKRELAGRHRFDREAYTNAKSDFVVRMTRAALARQGAPSEPATTGL